MNFPDQSQRKRKASKALQPKCHCLLIVDDLLNILRMREFERPALEFKDVYQRSLRAFDLAGQNRLFANIHEHKKIRIW